MFIAGYALYLFTGAVVALILSLLSGIALWPHPQIKNEEPLLKETFLTTWALPLVGGVVFLVVLVLTIKLGMR